MLINHDLLVELGTKYLYKTKKCVIVLYESGSWREIPDCIGWTSIQNSILIECKTSLEDFKRDQDKIFRIDGTGLGNRRYYLTPKGLLNISLIPEDWGLLEINQITLKIRQVKEAKYVFTTKSMQYQQGLLFYNVIRKHSHNIELIENLFNNRWKIKGHFGGLNFNEYEHDFCI